MGAFLIKFRASVAKDIHGFFNLCLYGQPQIALQDSFFLVGFGQDFSPGVNDGGMPCQFLVTAVSAGSIAGDNKKLIFDSS